MRYAKRFVFGVGLVMMFVMTFVLFTIGANAIQRASSRLNDGYVESKAYNDGHKWYSSIRIGDFVIKKEHGGESYFYVTVRNGEKHDFWVVSPEEWEMLSVGDYVKR